MVKLYFWCLQAHCDVELHDVDACWLTITDRLICCGLHDSWQHWLLFFLHHLTWYHCSGKSGCWEWIKNWRYSCCHLHAIVVTAERWAWFCLYRLHGRNTGNVWETIIGMLLWSWWGGRHRHVKAWMHSYWSTDNAGSSRHYQRYLCQGIYRDHRWLAVVLRGHEIGHRDRSQGDCWSYSRCHCRAGVCTRYWKSEAVSLHGNGGLSSCYKQKGQSAYKLIQMPLLEFTQENNHWGNLS